MKRGFGLLLALVLMLMLAVSVGAQDMTPTMEAGATANMLPATLGDVTGNNAAYLGQNVIIEGFIEEFISADAFILGENVAIGNDRVLVINNSGRGLQRDLFAGANVVLSGWIRPSYNRVADGSITVDVAPMDTTMENDFALMNESNIGQTSYGLYYTGFYPEDYYGFTVLELADLTTIQLVPQS